MNLREKLTEVVRSVRNHEGETKCVKRIVDGLLSAGVVLPLDDVQSGLLKSAVKFQADMNEDFINQCKVHPEWEGTVSQQACYKEREGLSALLNQIERREE